MSEMCCKRCGANEDRINGFCSVECEEYYRLEEEINTLDNVILERGAEIDRLNARIAELEGIVKADNLRLINAGLSAGLYSGCDTAEMMAKEILASRARIAECESALISMVQQFFYNKDGEDVFRHAFMSAEEEAATYLVEHGIARWADKRKSSIYFNEVQE